MNPCRTCQHPGPFATVTLDGDRDVVFLRLSDGTPWYLDDITLTVCPKCGAVTAPEIVECEAL